MVIEGETAWPHNQAQCGRYHRQLVRGFQVAHTEHGRLALVRLDGHIGVTLRLWQDGDRWQGESYWTQRAPAQRRLQFGPFPIRRGCNQWDCLDCR